MTDSQYIPIYEPFFNGRESVYVNQCLDAGWISSRGEFVAKFENSFSSYLGIANSTTVCNGTAALHLALHALGLGPGDEVIVPSFTYIATVNSIEYVRAKPVFCDVDPLNWNIDLNSLLSCICSKTKALLIPHIYGSCCDLDHVLTIAKHHNLYIIEDVAEAFGSKFDNQYLGSFGDLSTFSFYGNKTITTGEGGMISSDNEEIITYIRSLKSHSMSTTQAYWHDELGFNFRMTNIASAIGFAQLETADYVISRKILIASLYRHYLNNYDVEFQFSNKRIVSTHWLVACLFDSIDTCRSVSQFLRKNNIDTRPLFQPIHHMPMYANRELSLPVTEDLARRGLCLPSYPTLTEAQIDRICSCIKQALK